VGYCFIGLGLRGMAVAEVTWLLPRPDHPQYNTRGIRCGRSNPLE